MLKFLQVFPKVIYLGVAMESLLSEEEVWTCHDTIKELMSYPKYRSVKVINNPARLIVGDDFRVNWDCLR